MFKKSITEKDSYDYWHARATNEAVAIRNRDAYEYMLSDARGRWFLMSLMNETFYNSTTFTGNSTSFFNEGKRAVCVNIIRQIGHLLGADGLEKRLLAEKEYYEFIERLKETDEDGRG